MHEVRFVLFHDLGRRRSFRLLPDEIHFGVNRAEREPRLENQQDTAVEKKARTRQTQAYWNHVIALIASEGMDDESAA